MNPHVKFTTYNTAFTKENALDIIKDYDVVADGSDNFPTRYLVNDACVLAGKTNVYAAIFRFEGQVSVFNYQEEREEIRHPNYRDLFPEPPPPGTVPSCAEGGVLGVLPGIIGSMQASEVIKVITGIGEPLVGRFFHFDAASFTSRILKISVNAEVSITELIDYDAFCGIVSIDPMQVKEISVEELKAWMNAEEDFQLIDVREAYEYEDGNLGGVLIPFAEIPKHISNVARDKKVVIHCRSGKRSAAAIMELQRLGKFENLYSLKGGILAFQTV
ncbi:MAG: ThiF family adenylyltransferase, partial [Saprospiraceae bacterium]